jgi:hypothetical protein
MIAWQPDTPRPQLRQVWRWFCDLAEIRGYGRLTEPANTPDGRLAWQVRTRAHRLMPSEIEAWARLACIRIEPWQFAAISIIDDFFVRTRNDPPQPQVRADAGGLRAMFKALGMGRKKKR